MAKTPSLAKQIVLFVGGPDTGKTNYLARLWASLTEPGSLLYAPELPDQVEYLEATKRHLARGEFVPRSAGEKLGDLSTTVFGRDGYLQGASGVIEVPDVMGELWKEAATEREIDPVWMEKLRRATGALLFVRPMSDENVQFLDWVTAAEWMHLAPEMRDAAADRQMASQAIATEVLNFLDEHLGIATSGQRLRVAVVASSWDAVPPDVREADPLRFLDCEFPMFAGRVRDCERLEILTFGCSIVGGDLKDDATFKVAYRDIELEAAGYVYVSRDGGTVKRSNDLTLPLAWVLGGELPDEL